MDLPLSEAAMEDPLAGAAPFATKLAPPAPHQSNVHGNAEEDGKQGRAEGRRAGKLVGVSSGSASVSETSPVTDLERKLRRAERFGVQVVLSEEEKRNSRAERFGIDSNMSGSKIARQAEEQKRKARAERFGLKVDNPVDEAAKKKARLERFAPNSKLTTSEEEKMKARAIRFSQDSSKVNGRLNSDTHIGISITRSPFSNCATRVRHMKSKISLLVLKHDFDGTSHLVEMYISGKDKLRYINRDFPQPALVDPTFRRWHTENAIVKGWLTNYIDASLIGNFIRFPIAKSVWGVLATTYFDGSDTSQVYDLHCRVTRLKQAGGDHLDSLVQEDRVYLFLDGLDDHLDNIRSDILQLQSFPTLEQAFAHVRRETTRQLVMTNHPVNDLHGASLATRGPRSSPRVPPHVGSQPSFGRRTDPTTKALPCSHCGGVKHSRDNCGLSKASLVDERDVGKEDSLFGPMVRPGRVAVAGAATQTIGQNVDLGQTIGQDGPS
ncbi:hypothetical protein ZIOFF_018637 [Zingiber officinale]|uniref:THO1-MOS11 C-terminal domain-containing protein n=1 Tax=Zingiber officinale TaxID=94328 RepID=A0A8J5H6K8_ZINOF|nr:hypothetical protein ZIOFF_018637 [Zingiber officinale]